MNKQCAESVGFLLSVNNFGISNDNDKMYWKHIRSGSTMYFRAAKNKLTVQIDK